MSSRSNTCVTVDSNNEETSMESLPALDECLRQWREEQHRVASQVIVLEDPSYDTSPDSQYMCIPSKPTREKKLYGGVDVSFPKEDSDPSVAVYVILRGQEVVYQDHMLFHLSIPYVSSYLSFREIDPLESLVKKQIESRPDVTPDAILVDGNGIMHERQAGIACFLGIRTGIPTIGVGKTLYCQDGITKDLVKTGIEKSVSKFCAKCKSDIDYALAIGTDLALVIDRTCIDAGAETTGPPTRREGGEAFSMEDAMTTLTQYCGGFGVKLKGAGGRIWGCALVGHGGKIRSRKNGRDSAGTKNPIFVSVGHNTSLQEAVQICAENAVARIPEPVRVADLSGRELLRVSASQCKFDGGKFPTTSTLKS